MGATIGNCAFLRSGIAPNGSPCFCPDQPVDQTSSRKGLELTSDDLKPEGYGFEVSDELADLLQGDSLGTTQRESPACASTSSSAHWLETTDPWHHPSEAKGAGPQLPSDRAPGAHAAGLWPQPSKDTALRLSYVPESQAVNLVHEFSEPQGSTITATASSKDDNKKGSKKNNKSIGSSTGTCDREKSRTHKIARSMRMGGMRWTTKSKNLGTSIAAPIRPTSGNVNIPQDYRWLESVLEKLACNQAGSLTCKDTATGKALVPIFFMIGACPNLFCGMQAVMYSVGGDGEVDFWWVKPSKSETDNGNGTVEASTLSRHAKGPYKNDPGRSKPFYKPLADLFHQDQVVEGLRFGIEKAAPGRSSRAFLEQASGGKATRQYMHLVWQEEWTSNPFARSKYIKGKIVYQKDPQKLEFFARQYAVVNGAWTISDHEEQPFTSVLPGVDIKELRAE